MTDQPLVSHPVSLSEFPDVATFIWDMDSDRGFYSPRALDLFGIAQSPNLNEFIDLVHPDDRLRVESEATALLERGGSASHEYRILRPDGGMRHVFSHVVLNPRVGGTGPVLRGMFIDITRKQQLEDWRDRVQDRARILGCYDYDAASGITKWSPELRRLMGREDTPAVSVKRAREMVHPDDRARFEMMMQAALRAPGPYDITFRVRDSDGAVRSVRDRGEAHAPLDPATGMVARATGTLTDVTLAVSRPESFVSAHETFWNLIDAAPFGVYAVDADMRIVRLSKGGRAAFAGIDPLIGRDLSEVLHIMWPESFASEAVGHFRRTLATGDSYRAAPVIERRSDNQVIEAYDWGIDRMRLADGQYGVVCHFYDLTERVRQETALRESERRLTLAYEAADMGAWEVNLLTGETHWTPPIFSMFAATDDCTDIADLWRKTIHPDDLGPVSAAFDSAVAGGAPFDVDFRIVLPDGEIRYLTSKGEVVRNEADDPIRVIGVNYDITTRKQGEFALKDSEERLRLVMDSTIAFVGVLSPTGVLTEANKPALLAANLNRADVIGKPFDETFWWSHSPEASARLRGSIDKVARGAVVRYDAQVRVADDQLITIDFLLAPVYDADGKAQMLVASGFDVSEREEARTHVQSLMGEINHRTKNILTLVQIVARQTARSGAADFLERFEKRISALAAAQDLLVNSSSDHAELRDLAHAQLAHFEDLIGKRLHLSGDTVKLAPNAAQAIGMALHELATNAGKYGALSTDTGEVYLNWTVGRDDDGHSMLQMHWKEQGGPPVVEPTRRGFGSALIDQMARTSLDGTVELDYAPGGLEWYFTCPVEALLTRH